MKNESRMPAILREAFKDRTTTNVTYDIRAEKRDVARLRKIALTGAAGGAQWSYLVVFDYLTDNYNMVASMQVI